MNPKRSELTAMLYGLDCLEVESKNPRVKFSNGVDTFTILSIYSSVDKKTIWFDLKKEEK